MSLVSHPNDFAPKFRIPVVEQLVKIILIGESSVGKSCVLRRFTRQSFVEDNNSTIGVDFEIKCLSLWGKNVTLQIWDTAGQERFHTITTTYYRSSDAVMLIFDVANLETFARLNKWMDELRSYAKKSISCMLVGNKNDLDAVRQVDYNTAKEWADANNMPYIETSAREGSNIEKAFADLAMTALSLKMAEKDNDPNQVNIQPARSEPAPAKSSCAC
eukprot:TRINITY_DN11959_c0_g1_i5.p1 TRINITY_DN11959_c0_g1~~TRINITY_DN11959_c0_g1_i5.p1  ORF type:complete len:236 (-),score=49.46 TRINITY_DN11959_c0_g1_i5:102-752(-)